MYFFPPHFLHCDNGDFYLWILCFYLFDTEKDANDDEKLQLI